MSNCDGKFFKRDCNEQGTILVWSLFSALFVNRQLTLLMTLIKQLTWASSVMVNWCKCAKANILYVSK